MEKNKYEYAGFWIRVGASLIDMTLIFLIVVPAVFWIYGFEMVVYGDSIILGVADVILNYVLPFVITILFWYYKSATPGKLWLYIKIVDEKSGEKMTVKQSLIRYFSYIPSILVFMLGMLWVGYDRKKQGWHDKIASTVVIVEKKPVSDVAFTDINNIEN